MGCQRLIRRTNVTRWIGALLNSHLLVFLLCLVYFAASALLRPEIASAGNLQNLLLSALPLALLAIGQGFVVITGGIDLSLTGVIALASVVGASVMTTGDAQWAGPPLGIAGGVGLVLAVGLAVGLVQGAGVGLAGMPPFLVTLTTLMFCSGAAAWYTQSRPIAGLPESLLKLDYGKTWGLPTAIWLVGLVALLAHIILSHTAFGRRIYAVGQNRETARVSGVRVWRTTMAAYVISGLMAATAALLYMARLETAKPDLVKDDVLLDCIGAVVIGGVSLFGGRGTVLGVLLGTLFMVQVSNSLNLLGTLKIWHLLVIKGGVILLAAMLDAARERYAAAGGGA